MTTFNNAQETNDNSIIITNHSDDMLLMTIIKGNEARQYHLYRWLSVNYRLPQQNVTINLQRSDTAQQIFTMSSPNLSSITVKQNKNNFTFVQEKKPSLPPAQ